MTPKAIAKHFLTNFPSTLNWRTVGREAEHPVVDPQGNAVDIKVLWPHLKESGDYKVLTEGSMIVGLEGDYFSFTSEVGKGTIEIITSPQQDLVALQSCYEQARDILLLAAEKENLWVLGYGIQPKTPPTDSLMTPKQRYGTLLDVLGPDWLWFTLTASDQVHVAITADEFVRRTNLGNLLAPATIALCANSPIFGGNVSPWSSAREGCMGQIHAAHGRHGLPPGPIASPEDYIQQIIDLPHLMLKRSGENKPQTGIFQSHLALNEALSAEDMYADFLHHEHYVWHSARPRSAHGTVELRSAGQQPPKEHMVASALGLGIVQGGERLEQLLHKEFGAESWAVMRSWHHEVVKHGLKAEAPTPTLLTDILDIAAESLDDRKLNEARFLSPLYSRIKLKENPAQRALASYHSAGMEGMLSLVRCT